MDDSVLAALVVSVILERPTCLVCIAAKVGATQLETLRTIERIGSNLRVETEVGDRCRSCGSTIGPVYAFSGPA